MTIEYKQPITLVILNQVLEWCYTDILDFSSLEMYPLLVDRLFYFIPLIYLFMYCIRNF